MNRTIDVAPVRRTVTVAADPDVAFEVFTRRIASWWPRTHTIATAAVDTVVIEPRVGGRWFEIASDRSETDWGTVLAWEPPLRLLLGWQLDPDFRYDPSITTEVEVRFIAAGDGTTRVELEHRHLDRFGAKGADLSNKVGSPNGWPLLLDHFAAAVMAPA
jgi:hypothetical protein